MISEGMTKDFEGFLAIPLFITLLDSGLISPNFDLRYVYRPQSALVVYQI